MTIETVNLKDIKNYQGVRDYFQKVSIE